MGFRLKSYSLNELHRIAVPSAVAPSLFWALPVGGWNARELDEIWCWFTQRPGECNDLGLLLVKDMGQREGEADDVNLASVGARLADLMPAGAERFVTPTEYQGQSPRILVLSGGYPQPGWGVLVEWPRRDVHRFEELIQRTTTFLTRGQETTIRQTYPGTDGEETVLAKLDAFKEAAEAFHGWQKLRAAPAKPKVSSLGAEILAAEKVINLLREADTALQAGDYRFVDERLIAVMQQTGQAPWLNIPEGSIQSLVDAQRSLLTAASVLAVSSEVLRTEIEPILQALLADVSKREAAFRNLSNERVKCALEACLHLRSEGIVEPAGSFQAWATQILAEVPSILGEGMAKVMGDIDVKLVSRRGAKAQLEHEYDISMSMWRQRSRQARDRFHVAAGKAVELQWELGPLFLVAFEDICRKEGLWVRSVPWDPARMVGWKIMVSTVKLDFRDLQIAAQELAPEATGVSPANGTGTTVADGSYFTDYVHHIAISKPGFSPRSVTRDLLARLVRPAEMMALIKTLGGQAPTTMDAPHLAEDLLHALGWRQSDETRERPLAGCIKTGGDTMPVLVEHLSGNDLRIVLESFCKDIVDVVVAQLGYGQADVWSAIEERIPIYRPSSRAKDWEEEVRLMTVGAAVMILPALGPLAFPESAKEVNEFAKSLSELSELLNRASHHREGELISSDKAGEAPELIRRLLVKAEAFLGELPWHLDASFIYGEQPKVLSGEAWSHGSPAPRLLRVIVWTGTSPGAHVTLWNRTRRNPIVTDPVFIVRPRKPQ